MNTKDIDPHLAKMLRWVSADNSSGPENSRTVNNRGYPKAFAVRDDTAELENGNPNHVDSGRPGFDWNVQQR